MIIMPVAVVGDMNAESLVARHAQLVVHVRPAMRDRAGRGLVHGDRDVAYLAAVHALEPDQMAGFVRDRYAHCHADLARLCRGAFDH